MRMATIRSKDPRDLDESGEDSVLRCLHCKSLLKVNLARASTQCRYCGADFENLEGIPILVRDRHSIEAMIQEAKKSGRRDWYETPQSSQWHGPYRHHLGKRRVYLEKTIAKYSRKSTLHRGLDLGCGDGGNLEWLRKYVEELYGSDYNLLRLTRAVNSKSAKLLFMADITDYPANDNIFDLIFFNHVLEHIPEDLKALTEAHRILKHGGLLIVGVPNEGAMVWQLAYKIQPKVLKGTDHVHFYTAESLMEKCSEAGLKILEIKHIGWGIPHWSLDEKIRTYKAIDDLLEKVGRALAPSQATSLYLIGTK